MTIILLNNLINDNKISQINVSKSLINHRSIFFPNSKYKNLTENTLFWGVYNKEDILLIKKHKGMRWIYWHDNDCNPNYSCRRNTVKSLKKLNNTIHLCDKELTSKYLDKLNIPHIIIKNNLNKSLKLPQIKIQKSTNYDVSVIVPVYNSDKTIRSSLDSLIYQTYKSIEIIVIDDCSTDNSYDIIQNEYINKYHNIKLYKTKENSGCYIARNIGIKNSKSEFIAYQDADDISLPHRIEYQINKMRENKLDLCGCKWIRSKYKYNNLDIKKILRINKKYNKNKWMLAFASIIIRRDIFNKIGFLCEKYRHSMDYEFYDRYYYYKKSKICNYCIYNFFSKNRYENKKFYYLIDKLLYISPPLNENNITIKYLSKLNNNEKKNIRNQFFLEYYKSDLLN